MLLPVFLIGLVLYINFYYGYLVLAAGSPGYEAFVNEQTYFSPQRLRVRPGTYQVSLRGPRVNSQTIPVSVGLRSEVVAVPTAPPLTDEQIVREVLSTDNEYTVYSVIFFEKDYWFVAYTGAPEEDTSMTIGRYIGGVWNLVDSGTFLTGEDVADAPDSVKLFLDEGTLPDESH